MGLKIHSIAEIPENASRSYYLYILDYYNWDEPIGNTLRNSFDKIAEFASRNDSVVIQGIGESHFIRNYCTGNLLTVLTQKTCFQRC